MYILKALSDTPIGRALIAYFFDLPRWTLVNILFAASLTPAFLALLNGAVGWIGLLTFPVVMVSAGMINMAAREVIEEIPRWRDALTHPATYLTAFTIWVGLIVVLTVLLADPPMIVFFIICAIALALLMVSVCALFTPALLKAKGVLVWRNALVLAVHYPMVALGLVALLAVGGWVVWISRGTLLLLVPALWTMIAVFSVQDRISALQPTSQSN